MNYGRLNLSLLLITILSLFLLMACAPKHRIIIERETPPPEKKEKIKEEKPAPTEKVERWESKGVQYGVASWYGSDFHGKPHQVARFMTCIN